MHRARARTPSKPLYHKAVTASAPEEYSLNGLYQMEEDREYVSLATEWNS